MAGRGTASSQRGRGARTAAADAITAPSDERHAHDQHAGQGDVSVGVGNTREDGAVLEQTLEAPQVRAHGEHRRRTRRGSPTSPRQNLSLRRGRSPLRQDTRAAHDRDERRGDQAGDDRQRQQPSGDELQGRQREQVEVERSPEDGVEQVRAARRIASTAPMSSSCAAMLAPMTAAMRQRQPEPDQLEETVDRQRHRPAG